MVVIQNSLAVLDNIPATLAVMKAHHQRGEDRPARLCNSATSKIWQRSK
jgi:hypothetical protein